MEPSHSDLVNLDECDDEFLFTPISIGGDEKTSISVEHYNELRDINVAIMASLKDSSNQHFNKFVDLRVLDFKTETTPIDRKLKGPLKGEMEMTSKSKTNPVFICEICVQPKSLHESFSIKVCNCKHAYCKDCMSKYVASKLKESITNIKCPLSDCEGLLEPEYCRAILPKEVFDRWGNALCETVILASEKFYCPCKDCYAMMIHDGDKGVKESECPNCRRLFCAQYKVPWHRKINCEEFQKLHKDERNREDILLKKLAENKHWRRCPKCKIYVERTHGCRQMRCRYMLL